MTAKERVAWEQVAIALTWQKKDRRDWRGLQDEAIDMAVTAIDALLEDADASVQQRGGDDGDRKTAAYYVAQRSIAYAERLEAENKRLRGALQRIRVECSEVEMWNIAHAALEGELNDS